MHAWMTYRKGSVFNMVKLNEDKKEFIILGAWQQLNKAANNCVYIEDKTFQSTNPVCNLGFHIEQTGVCTELTSVDHNT